MTKSEKKEEEKSLSENSKEISNDESINRFKLKLKYKSTSEPPIYHKVTYENDGIDTGNFNIVAVEAANSTDYIHVSMPSNTIINAAYPNPFNPSTTVNYILSISI